MGKRKGNGEGSITKRADGRYMARFTVDGKRKTVYGLSFEEVRQKLTEKLNDLSKGVYMEFGKDTIESWLYEWLVTYALPTVKQSTYISYEGYVRNHIVPEMGKEKLSTLNKDRLQRFFNKKKTGTKTKKGLSPKTLKNIYNMLNSVLDGAVESKKLLYNPIKGVRLPPIEKKEMKVLDPLQQLELQNAAIASEELSAFGIIFALSTGVRVGELCGFRWTDLNQFTRYIHVYRTVGRLNKVDEDGNVMKKSNDGNSTEIVVRTPKSQAARRDIPLFDELWDGLMDYKKRVRSWFESHGLDFDEEGYIFCNPFGQVYDPRVYDDLYKRTLKAAGLEKINFHALRHTFATRALEAGMDIKVLSSLLGHAQPSTTLNLYAHALPDHKRASMKKMSGYYTSSSKTNLLSEKKAG